MREDLKAFGNELNYYKMACKPTPPLLCIAPGQGELIGIVLWDGKDNTAYVLGQIPLMTLQTKGKL